MLTLPGPTNQSARVWSRYRRTDPWRGPSARWPDHPHPAPHLQLPQAPALTLFSPAGGCSWRSGPAGSLRAQVRGRKRALGQWPPPRPCWGWRMAWTVGKGKRRGSAQGPKRGGCPSGMWVRSGCGQRGRSLAGQGAPEWRLPPRGGEQGGKSPAASAR